ncbi:glycosyltransferase [Paradesertivirga mongoliensis]|uniref:Glycosyltransferase n=1 Tax=Paradesertivirga mongoliensis TaxID=2100740 RepID=A0ABW4ZLG8_9SPHI|nr:glycosyltransferase [Pedobacter mongoliensis]
MLVLLFVLWIFIQVVIGYNLLLPFILSLVHYFVRPKGLSGVSETEPDYAVIITAYQYTDTLPQAVASVLKLNYDKFLVYVVADNCDTSTLTFDDERVILLKPEHVLKGNTRSHFYAIDRFKRQHDYITIIDSDNVVHPEYLNEITKCLNQGFDAVQGLREAKNLDTTYACLDAARDLYYHHFDCKVLFESGSSSTLSGSGMAFATSLYKECLQNEQISGAGFDKILQARIVQRDKRIAFAPSAILYDEKTSQPQQLVDQRSRWLNTWFKYFKLGFLLLWKGVNNFSWNQFLFGLILLRPPLFLFLILSVLLMLANLYVNPFISLIWMLALAVFTICFFKALLFSKADRRIYKALIGIPKFVFYQIISLTKVRKANIRSVSTRHYRT